MEPQVTLECEGTLPSGGPLMRDGDSGIAPSSPSPVGSQQPVKKQTRQWAAWTRQEEENFFNALRQVGKNFEKITWRVQSKNKDQVRHYYYRLVRRMNKLLGPGFSLDAKNSKDTNAAMLRWWSLLEKHSCTASKLHLKPRRFKIFIEALEHQLLKDRKKNTRKRPSPVENCSSSSPPDTSLQNKASVNDIRSGKLVIVDSQNIQRVASGKGSSLKRNVNTSTNRSNNKVDLNTMKTTRQRKKTGGSSSAAYKRWEKAAIAGVSLVADAAEHLERTKINKEVSLDQGMSDDLLPSALVSPSGEKCMHPFGNILRDLSLPTNAQNQVTGAGVQPMKLKLQLFPIDEPTRRALEEDEHNPYLELTLSARKRITSVLEHLSRKWGNSHIASGELMLFQYNVQRENLLGSQRWTQGTVASAADVYTAVGSPSVFRLRYGWLSNEYLVSVTCGPPSSALHLDGDMSLNIWNRKDQNAEPSPIPDLHTGPEKEQLMESPKDQPTFAKENTDFVHSYTEFPDDGTDYIGANSDKNPPESSEHVAISSCYKNKTKVGIIKRQWEDVENLRTSSGAPLSAGDWADSLTNISIGELLTDTSGAMETDAVEPPLPTVESSQYLQQIPFSCDSFDAAIADHIARHQGKPGLPPVQGFHAPSIWDGEETCDAFAFRKVPTLNQDGPSLSVSASLEAGKQIASTSSIGLRGLLKELPRTQATNNPVCEGVPGVQTQDPDDPVCEEDKTDDPESDTTKPDDSVKDLGGLTGLTDIYWPDSLGPFDLDIPASTYRDQDLIFSDSISVSGLNRLIANSLDAFQNCSFFGLDKKEPPSSSEACEPAAVFNCKIGGEV